MSTTTQEAKVIEAGEGSWYKKFLFHVLNKSLLASNKQRQQKELKTRLEKIVPDITKQFSGYSLNKTDTYSLNKMRCQHTFQVGLVKNILDKYKNESRQDTLRIVDIGDSAGTHLIYLKEIVKDYNFPIECMSVNLDPIAVEKIKAKGLDAVCCRAEELESKHPEIKADVYITFEMVEHLLDPIRFLHSLSEKTTCDYLILSVPYVAKSRVGLSFVRHLKKGQFYAEHVHIFELAPSDWDLIFKFAGWEVVHADKYTQYPKNHPLYFTKYLWRKIDFDGFYGVILKRNDAFTKCYQDWF